MTSKIIQWYVMLLLINQYSPKIIAVEETRLHSLSNISIPINYNLYSTNSSNTRYGGVRTLHPQFNRTQTYYTTKRL